MTERSTAGDPLHYTDPVPNFAAIARQHVEPALRRMLELRRDKLVQLQRAHVLTIDSLEELAGRRQSPHRVQTPVSHLRSVASTPAPGEAPEDRLPLAGQRRLGALFGQSGSAA